MGEKRYYMACLDLEGRSCLVVGGGPVGLEKARGLVECGARVTVVAPEALPELHELPVALLRRPYERADLEGRFLVVAATDDAALNRRVFADAEARGLLCNVADVPELCSFILPAVHREGPIAVAVSTGGASPALAQRLRGEIAALVGPEHAELARLLRALRPWARERFATYEERRDWFRRLVESSSAPARTALGAAATASAGPPWGERGPQPERIAPPGRAEAAGRAGSVTEAGRLS